MKLAVVDYGVGNLFSLKSSLKHIGCPAEATADPEIIRAAERIILPGVGAFGDAAAKLRETGLDRVVLEQAASGTPLLGICLGMQLLFEGSSEYGLHRGLGLLKGRIVDLRQVIPPQLKVPHMGWNSLSILRTHPLLADIPQGSFVYFVHSFYATDCESSRIATADYGVPVTAVVAEGCVMGCQFHPEKSGDVGLQILRNFCTCDREALYAASAGD
jgi:glutamine amidotransferase